jgi:hypothetical protein
MELFDVIKTPGLNITPEEVTTTAQGNTKAVDSALDNGVVFEVAAGIWGLRDVFVNCYMIRDEESGKW